MRTSVIITIYNEERNVGRLLEALLADRASLRDLERILVVSSACRDRSDEIVREVAARHGVVQLLVEPERRGKASAVNLGLAACRSSDVVVLSSGDVVPAPGAVGRLLAALDDPAVGMVGGRPVPTGEPTCLVHRVVRLQWELHHEVALRSPKLGEIVAFRNVVERMPSDTAVDEASLESAVRDEGLRLAYVPEAVVWNKGPDTVADLLKQRRRIAAGHGHLASTRGHVVSTNAHASVARIALRALLARPSRLPVFAAAAALEAVARVLGAWDLHVRGRSHHVWEVATSTKDPAVVVPPSR